MGNDVQLRICSFIWSLLNCKNESSRPLSVSSIFVSDRVGAGVRCCKRFLSPKHSCSRNSPFCRCCFLFASIGCRSVKITGKGFWESHMLDRYKSSNSLFNEKIYWKLSLRFCNVLWTQQNVIHKKVFAATTPREGNAQVVLLLFSSHDCCY